MGQYHLAGTSVSLTSMVHAWQAAQYDALELPHLRWGDDVITALELQGSETVLDAGAGTGRDTMKLVNLLPRGRIIAVDASPHMLGELRRKVADAGAPIEVIESDLSKDFGIHQQCDAVMSVATFHWIADHDALFANLATTMKPGARLVADCGGRSNVARVSDAFAKVTGIDPNSAHVWNFADVPETTASLAAAGFSDIDVRLVEDPAIFASSEAHCAFLTTVVLGAQLETLPPEDHLAIVAQVSRELGEYLVDYVRLKIFARRI